MTEDEVSEKPKPLLFVYDLPGNGKLRLIKETAYDEYISKLESENAALAERVKWQPLVTAPDRGYHLLCDSSQSHLSGVFLGQVVDGKPWDVQKGVYVKADHWMPITVPDALKSSQQVGEKEVGK